MNRQRPYLAFVALLVGVIAFASSFARPSSGQAGAPVVGGEGRYRLSTTTVGTSVSVYVIDSATGRTWSYQRGRDWFDMGTPVPAK